MSQFIANLVEYIKYKIKEIKDAEPEQDAEEASHLIKQLIDFRTSILVICKDCFNDNQEIRISVMLQLQKLLAEITDFPRYLAEYIDGFIVKMGRDNNNDPREIDEVFEIINLTAERDAFLYYYEIALKNRLLAHTSFLEEIEKDFLSRLSQLFGENQIMKVKGMINDIVGSRDILAKFKEYTNSRAALKKDFGSIEFEISVLTKANWPSEVLQTDVCNMPSGLDKMSKEFNTHYTKYMGNRKLEWLLDEGYVELNAHFEKGKKLLMVKVAQMAILGALDDSLSKSLKLSDIYERTKLDSRTIKPHL